MQILLEPLFILGDTAGNTLLRNRNICPGGQKAGRQIIVCVFVDIVIWPMETIPLLRAEVILMGVFSCYAIENTADGSTASPSHTSSRVTVNDCMLWVGTGTLTLG